MKKLTALLMALAMTLTLFAGCATDGGNTDTTGSTAGTTESTEPSQTETQPSAATPGSALDVLETIWNAFGEDEQFPVYGGDMETHTARQEEDETYQIPNGPGTYAMEYIENLPYTIRIPADILPNVDDAATMMHMMLANNFTSGALHLTEGSDVEAITAAIRDELSNTQWMCGFPERYFVAVVGGEYIVVAFGLNDALNPFQEHLTECFPDAVIAYNEDVA